MRRLSTLVIVTLMVPVAFADSSAEPAGDQNTRVFVAGPASPTLGGCADASTDATSIETVTGERWGEVRLTMRDLDDSRLVCHGQEVPVESRRYFLQGDEAEFYLDDSGCFVSVGASREFVALDYCFVEGDTVVWRFELEGEALDWCDCPAFDVRGMRLNLEGAAISMVMSEGVFVYVYDSISLNTVI